LLAPYQSFATAEKTTGDSLTNGKHKAMREVNRIDREAARRLAIQALEYLAAEPERLGRFLALSGLDPTTIRAAARQPEFLAGVLEYMLGDERMVAAFTVSVNVPPERIAEAHAVLAGRRWERQTP
jgi:hypothetical protein